MDWSYTFARTYLQTFEARGEDALEKYNVEVIQKFKSSRNLHGTTLIHDV